VHERDSSGTGARLESPAHSDHDGGRALGTAGITAGITAGVVLGGGVTSGAPPGTAPGPWAYPQAADRAVGGTSPGAGLDQDGDTTTPIGPAATRTQQVGIVDVDSILGYQGAEAAGTGMVLTSNGNVLTNNHVVGGATSITVRIVRSGAAYR
jgi:hypothetical protein